MANIYSKSTLRNMAHQPKSYMKNPESYRRKSFGSINNFRMSNMMYSQTRNGMTPKAHGASSKRCDSRYGSIIQESSTCRETGEYTYGKGGSSFPKQTKISKFDEEREKIYSPGPARYVPKTKEKKTTFSFGKQKKEFSFVKDWNREVPSPGKYKIKRDFLSKKCHRR